MLVLQFYQIQQAKLDQEIIVLQNFHVAKIAKYLNLVDTWLIVACRSHVDNEIC